MLNILLSFVGSVELHDYIMFYFLIILQGVGMILTSVITRFRNSNNLTPALLVNRTCFQAIWLIFSYIIIILVALLGYFFCFTPTVCCEGVPECTALVTATECTALVPAGYWDSYYEWLNSNIPRLGTLKSARAFIIPPLIYSILIGVIISDGNLQYPTRTCQNARFRLGQSKAHEAYLWFVFCILSPLCSSLPSAFTQLTNGVQCYSVRFYTRCLPIFTDLHTMFYNSEGRKILPPLVVLMDILTPEALAHVIIGDGTRHDNGLIICTDSFTVEEVSRLMTVLYVRYGIYSNLRIHKGDPRIYIRTSSMPTLRNLVRPHMHPSFMYKLGE